MLGLSDVDVSGRPAPQLGGLFLSVHSASFPGKQRQHQQQPGTFASPRNTVLNEGPFRPQPYLLMHALTGGEEPDNRRPSPAPHSQRSEEHTSELQSPKD